MSGSVARMNSPYETLDFSNAWQDDPLFVTLDASSGLFPNVSNGRLEATGFLHGTEAASIPREWLTLHSEWLQQDNLHGIPSSTTCEYPYSFPSYTTAQGYAHDADTTGPSDIGQSNSQSSFSKRDFDHLYNNINSSYAPQPLASSTATPAPQPIPDNRYASQAIQTRYSPNVSTPIPPSFQHEASRSAHAPPAKDSSANNPSLPRQQPNRWAGDLYTPTYVRGDGSTRAGWCGYCASWLTLKDSAYWYHMHFAHGISCATGSYLPSPIRFRPTLGAARGAGDAEALCGGCSRWVLVVMGEKGRTAWFRHAYRCLLKAAPARRERTRGKSASPRKVVAKPALRGAAR